MLKLLEHLFLLLAIGVFSYKNSLIIVFLIFSFISIILWSIAYYKRKKMKLDNKIEVDINVYVAGIAVVIVNLIYSMGIVNLAFGFYYLIIYFINTIGFVIRGKEKNINTLYLCDLYSTLYLAGLIMEISKYEL